MTPEEIAKLGEQPGAEGAMWRLIAALKPNEAMQAWVAAEHARGTPAIDLGRAFAALFATLAFGFAQRSSNLEQALYGPYGVAHCFERELKARVERASQKSEGGVFLPAPGRPLVKGLGGGENRIR